MSKTIQAWPLQWPVGWKRTAPDRQREAKFGRARRDNGNGSYTAARSITISEAVDRVRTELIRMAVDPQEIVISTNVRTRLDGLPRSGEPQPQDRGAAVYWRDALDRNKPMVMAIDQYDRVEDNLAAIAATIEAMRAIERHGGAVILERAFTGFAALPAPDAKRAWREVLGFAPGSVVTAAMVRDEYRRAAQRAHPDRPGGSDAAMAEVNQARDEALAEIPE